MTTVRIILGHEQGTEEFEVFILPEQPVPQQLQDYFRLHTPHQRKMAFLLHGAVIQDDDSIRDGDVLDAFFEGELDRESQEYIKNERMDPRFFSMAHLGGRNKIIWLKKPIRLG